MKIYNQNKFHPEIENIFPHQTYLIYFLQYIFESNPKYPIIAEYEPCDRTICLHVEPNCINTI